MESSLALISCGRARVRLALVVLIFLLAACATTRNPPPTSVVVEHPESIAGFTLDSEYQAEDPYEGTRLRYTSTDFGGLRVDLFAYLVGNLDDHEKALDQLSEGFVGSMKLAQEQGIYTHHEWLDRKPLQIDVGGRMRPARFLSHIQVSPDAGELMSLTYLMFRPPFALKVRASFPSHGNIGYNEAIAAFVKAVIPELSVTLPAACTDTEIQIDVGKAEGDDCDIMPQLVTGLTQGAETGCMDYETAEAARALVPKLVAECRAEQSAERAKQEK